MKSVLAEIARCCNHTHFLYDQAASRWCEPCGTAADAQGKLFLPTRRQPCCRKDEHLWQEIECRPVEFRVDARAMWCPCGVYKVEKIVNGLLVGHFVPQQIPLLLVYYEAEKRKAVA